MVRKSGIAWALGLLLFAVGSACSSEESGGGKVGAAGEAGSPDNQAGSKAESGSGGGGDAGATTGGAGGDLGGIGGDGMAGAGGECSSMNQCGGCDSGRYIVRCSWGNSESLDSLDYNARSACAYARGVFEGGEAGAGGASNGGAASGGASSGGAPGSDGICATYKAPGTSVLSCDSCIETESETKEAECTIRDECCVVVFAQYCGV